MYELNRPYFLRFKLQFVGTTYDVQVLTPKEAELVGFMKEPATIDVHNVVLSPMAGMQDRLSFAYLFRNLGVYRCKAR